MSNGKNVPIGVEIISVLYFISAAFLVILGIIFMIGAGFTGFFSAYLSKILPLLALFGVLGTILFIVTGIIFIGIGVLSFFIGLGLWKAKKWARIVAIIFACLGVLSAILGIISSNMSTSIIVMNSVSLIINGLIGGYLLFSKKVKEAFS
ncbi:MAG: hypothetical protein QXW97_03600 [Candidatus Pacearchaeota archaeon]